MRLKSKQSCVDCHFFVIKLRGHPGKHLPIEKPQRDKARQGEYSWIDASRDSMPGCYFDVWHKDYYESGQEEYHQLIVEKDQADSCFWWKYHITMRPEAAEILQEREARNRDAEHDRSLTRRGLRIATIALFINAAALVINAAPKWIELIFFRRP
mgnify:FL=1